MQMEIRMVPPIVNVFASPIGVKLVRQGLGNVGNPQTG